MTDDLLTSSDARRCGAALLRPQGRLHFRFSHEPVIYIIPVASAALLVNFISSSRDQLPQIDLSVTIITLGRGLRLSLSRGSLRRFRRFAERSIGFPIFFHYQLSVEINTRSRTNITCEGRACGPAAAAILNLLSLP